MMEKLTLEEKKDLRRGAVAFDDMVARAKKRGALIEVSDSKKTIMKTPVPFQWFEMLSEAELECFLLMEDCPGESMWILACHNVCDHGDHNRFRELIGQLQHQAADNPQVMEDILGTELYNSVMALNNNSLNKKEAFMTEDKDPNLDPKEGQDTDAPVDNSSQDTAGDSNTAAGDEDDDENGDEDSLDHD